MDPQSKPKVIIYQEVSNETGYLMSSQINLILYQHTSEFEQRLLTQIFGHCNLKY